MAGTVGWKSLGPTLLTVTRPVAAEGWIRARRVKTGGSEAITLSAWVDGGLRSLPAADKKDIRHLCHLKSPTEFKQAQKPLRLAKRKTNTCGYAHGTRASYMSDCLLLRWRAESCDTAKCELCTCPWNDHRQPESPWRNKLVKSQANKFTHHCQFPIHQLVCVCLSSTACLFDVYFLFLTYNYVRAYPGASLASSDSTSVKFYLIDFPQFRLVNPPSLSCLAYCVDVRPCCRHCLSSEMDEWRRGCRGEGRGKKKKPW